MTRRRAEVLLRSKSLNDHKPSSAGRFVVCLLRHSLRSVENPTIDSSIIEANRLGLPVIVVHSISPDYPFPSRRFHKFLLEASKSLELGVLENNLGFLRFVSLPGHPIWPAMVEVLSTAASVFVDSYPAKWVKTFNRRLAASLDVPVTEVDSYGLVPSKAISVACDNARSFRAEHSPLREHYLHANSEVSLTHTIRGNGLGQLQRFHHVLAKNLNSLLDRCAVDQSVRPVTGIRGYREDALLRLKTTVDETVATYRYRRNNPAERDGTSRLSPYLHFGVLAPKEVVQAIRDSDISKSAAWKFIDELLTWREFSLHRANSMADMTAFSTIPDWALTSLLEHSNDHRESQLSLEDFIYGRSPDPIWNAAQRQFLLDGWMHNNLRMYWVKQILKWAESPDLAWDIATYLNDRFSYDGRDPATYAGIRWGFGEGRKSYRENPIFGWVSPKSSRALKARAGVSIWVDNMLNREIPETDTFHGKATHW